MTRSADEFPAISQTAAARFLGPRGHADDPTGLLGFAGNAADSDAVMAALHESLRVVDQHPEAATPEADEVRLALHAAAASVLRAGRGSRFRVAPANAPGIDDQRVTLEADAITAIGLHGGWNNNARVHIGRVAHARGLSNIAVAETIFALAGPRGGAVPPSTAAHAQAVHAERGATAPSRVQRRSPGSTPLIVAAIATGLLMVAVAASVLLKGSASSGSSPVAVAPTPAAANPGPIAAASQRRTDSQDRPSAIERQTSASDARPRSDWRVLQHTLLRSAVATDLDDGLLRDTFERLATAWYSYPADARVALETVVIDHVMARVRQPAADPDALRFVLQGSGVAPGDAIAVRVWQAGILARLLRETDLPMALRVAARRALIERAGQPSETAATFETGAISALKAAIEHIETEIPREMRGEAWNVWMSCLRVTTTGPATRTSLALSALDAVVDRASDEAASSTIERLVVLCDWSTASQARDWLLALLLDDERNVSGARAVTSALATRSSAPGVDATMVLAATAGPLDRARLHDRYASVWRTEDNEGPNPADQFHAVRKSVDDFGWTAGPLGHLARAVAYANISAAARRLWDRDADGAAQRLEPLPGNIASIAAYAPPRRPSAASDNTEWARGFLALGTAVEPRSAMLDRFPARVNAVSPANAQVLVDAALRGSPVKIRQQAASIVSQLDGDTQIMLAMLEALPSAPKVRSSGELFGVFTLVDSGAVRGAAWQENVRAALITRINDNLAGAGESGVIDALADALAAAYADELGILPTPGEERDHAAAALWRAWAAIAPATARPMLGSAITMDEIERTRLARLAVAEGPGQRFLAEQIATVEAMASVTMQESPNAAPRVLQMIERLHTALMSGDQLFEQIAKTEAARLDLWLLRFEKRR